METHIQLNNKRYRYALLTLITLGSFVRLYNLGQRDFWYDEAFTGIAIRSSWSEMFTILNHDAHPPLYYILAKITAAPFNYSVWGIRLFSALAGIATLFLVYKITIELSNQRAGLIATFITAIAPFAIEYSQEARMYALLVLLQLATIYYFIRLMKTNRAVYAIGWGVTLTLSIYTHYITLVTVPIYYLSFVIVHLLTLPSPRRAKWKYAIPSPMLLLGYGIVALFFIPYLPHFIEQYKLSHTIIQWIPPAQTADVVKTLVIFMVGHPPGMAGIPIPNMITGTPLAVLVLLLITALGYTLYSIRHNYRALAIPLLIGTNFISGVFVLSLLGYHYFVARYLIVTAFALYILLGIALSYSSNIMRSISIGVFIVLLILINPIATQTGFNRLLKNTTLLEHKNIYVLNPYEYVVAKYYFGANRIILYNASDPTYNPYKWTGVNGTLKRTEHIETILKDKDAVILVNGTIPNYPLYNTHLNPLVTIANIQLYTVDRLSVVSH